MKLILCDNWYITSSPYPIPLLSCTPFTISPSGQCGGGGMEVEPFRGSCIFSSGEDIFEFDFICRMRKCLKNASRIIRASWKWQKTSYRTLFNRQRSKLKSKWPSRSKESNRIFTLLGVYIHSAFCILLNKTVSEYEFCVYNYVQ